MSYPTTQGYLYTKTYYYPLFTSNLISENSILTANNSKENDFSFQVIKKHIPTSISNWSMNITFHHLNNRDKYIVLHGILIGVQCYSNMLTITYLHPSGPCETIHNSVQYSLLSGSEFFTYVLNSFGISGMNLLPRRMKTYILHSKINLNLDQDDYF